jgi:hypothetical protein
MIPNFTSEVENEALSAATAMSQAAARPVPPPRAAPCMRAMVGLFMSDRARSMPAKRRASAMFSASP